MKDDSMKEFAESIFVAVRGYVEKAVEQHIRSIADPLTEKLAAIPNPERGEKGEPGPLPDDETIAVACAKAVAEYMAANPVKDGVDGRDGKNGNDGINGKDGDVGKDGESSFDIAKKNGFEGGEIDFVLSLRGKDGSAGDHGRDGRDGQKGTDGMHGKDGLNGADGLGFDDLSAEFDGERTVTLKFQRGDRIKSFEFVIPAIIDRGVYTVGKEYVQSDGVTFKGSYYIAQSVTTEEPGTGKGWRQAVRKGRDGKDGGNEPEQVGNKPVRLK